MVCREIVLRGLNVHFLLDLLILILLFYITAYKNIRVRKNHEFVGYLGIVVKLAVSNFRMPFYAP
jgi:hypothetical protein